MLFTIKNVLDLQHFRHVCFTFYEDHDFFLLHDNAPACWPIFGLNKNPYTTRRTPPICVVTKLFFVPKTVIGTKRYDTISIVPEAVTQQLKIYF